MSNKQDNINITDKDKFNTNKAMKLFKFVYSENYDFLYEKIPTYEIEVKAKNQSEAFDKARDMLTEKFIGDGFDIHKVKEMKEVKQ